MSAVQVIYESGPLQLRPIEKAKLWIFRYEPLEHFYMFLWRL